MNAVDFLKSNKNNKVITHSKILKDIERQTNPKDNIELPKLTIEDVLFGRFEKNKSNPLIQKTQEVDKKGKPKINKKNSKILKMFLQQEADIINDMEF